jgi:two-component system, LytTR family, sensor kinase
MMAQPNGVPTLLTGGFFDDRARAFWTLQTLGWLGYGFIRFFNGLANQRAVEYWKPTVIAVATGFVITLVFRLILRRIRTRPLPVVVFTVFVSSIFFALIFSAIETLGHVATYDPAWRPQGIEFFGNTMFDTYVLLSWAALYLIINYWLMIQAEREKTLSATAMAHQAQLKMLRYQLNPHFLFNTLNAISSLVLAKRYDKANGMLGKLSAFLRYSLVNQPTQKSTLEQELEALALYLDIEKVRFQKRLQVVIDVDKRARKALIPSLLLQPLIENAVKYAIAPAEDGGTITIAARLRGGCLMVSVTDSGPGLRKGERLPDLKSSGVGIANIRARLVQAYGEQQSFTLKNLKPRGLEAAIVVPAEFEEKAP